MYLKAALVAATASALLLVGACGGDGEPSQVGSSGSSSESQPPPTSSFGGWGTGAHASVRYVAVDLGDGVGTGIAHGEQVGATGYGASVRAVLWRGSASTVVDLHPGLWHRSVVTATSGGIQVGWGGFDDNEQHALKWAGTAGSVVDLHPTGQFRYSQATGVSGDQIVGWGEVPGAHALLWTSRGVVDLHPNGFTVSQAFATDGTQQVGHANGHALLWTGTADSAVDLHAGGYCFSIAYGVAGGQQVGFGGCDSQGRDVGGHALLWTGSAQSLVNLHPNGLHGSVARAVAAGRQVGYGMTADGSSRALLWNGTADSVVDLHIFLPAGFRNSKALGIDAAGNVIGTADDRAILWVRQ